MNEYKFEVVEDGTSLPLKGTVKADNIETAKREVLEWYAEDLGTTVQNLGIKMSLNS